MKQASQWERQKQYLLSMDWCSPCSAGTGVHAHRGAQYVHPMSQKQQGGPVGPPLFPLHHGFHGGGTAMETVVERKLVIWLAGPRRFRQAYWCLKTSALPSGISDPWCLRRCNGGPTALVVIV